MPLGFGGDIDVSVAVDGGPFLPGNPVRARVTVSGELDKRVRSSRVELLYRNEYKYETRDRDHDDIGSDRRVVTGHEDVIVAQGPISEQVEGLIGSHDVELVLPPEVPPTAGDLVDWKVRAVVDRRMAMDPDGEARIAVLSPPGLYAAWAQAPYRADPACDMRLDLPERVVSAGEVVRGTLWMIPRTHDEVTELRVELRQRRDDQDGLTDTTTVMRAQVAGAGQLAPGQQASYPFELPVPEGQWPSFRAAKNEVHWWVEGIAARKMKGDYNVTAEVAVHTGTPTGP